MTLRETEDLIARGLIPADQKATIDRVATHFSTAISPAMLNLIENDPIARQFVPSKEELTTTPEELSDPIGDTPHTKVKGIIHRYPDRCLFQPVNVCAVYCRFCFRRENVGPGKQKLNRDELEAAFAYIASNPQIWEVILSGGDPLTLSPKSLQRILNRLSEIPHVEVLRIHTRIPIVAPEQVDVESLKTSKPLYIVIHANHSKEFTPEAKITLDKLVQSGIPLLGQSVLLKGVNDDPDTLGELMRTMVRNRIKPYYLHHPDLAKGTSHFRLPIKEGQTIVKQLRGRYSGLCQPTYVLDIPGGYGKVPIHPTYIKEKAVEDIHGQLHSYSGSEA